MTQGYLGLQAVLNNLAGTTGLGIQAAANKWAGTTGLGLQAALNSKAGTKGLGLAAAANKAASVALSKTITGYDLLGALNVAAGYTG